MAGKVGPGNYDAYASAWAKDCGVCHVGGGQLEYDYDMKPYGDPTSTDTASLYVYQQPYVSGGTAHAGGIVLVTAAQTPGLSATNKAEVDCMMCHMSVAKPGAAWYKNTLLCSGTNVVGPADNMNCNGFYDQPFQPGVDGPNPDTRFTFTAGEIYDSFNRNAAMSYGHFAQAASAGLGAGIDLATGALSGVPSSIPGSSIASVPNSQNCAFCHARAESDNIGLPGEAQRYGGMIAGYGNFFRISAPGTVFDWDKVATDGNCASGDCSNSTQWNEFGCKTGMGKRAQKTGYGSSDRFGFGICLGCATFNAMMGDMTTGWFNGGVCAMPSVQAACNEKAGATLQGGSGEWMGIFADPMTMTPKQIVGKMPDVDVHDASGMKCATCHYTLSGERPARTISGNGASYTYPALTYAAGTAIEKMDHQVAQGFSTLEKANEINDGTVTCESCHIDKTHPNAAAAPTPTHAGFPAVHFEKIDCRTCHISSVYSSPGRLLFRDWTAGAYRQADGANGNANHFDFAFDFMDGGAAPMAPLKAWVTTPEGTKISPILPSLLPVWMDGSVPAKTRDITAAAALVAANNPGFGIRLNGTNEHPAFQGFQLTDPLKIESKAKIDAMVDELKTTGAGLATHDALSNPRLNLFPTMFDPSHGILQPEWALGGAKTGGCTACHSSSAVNPMTGQPIDPATYRSNSVGFFDGTKDLMKNGMMQMADYDCGGNDLQFQAGTAGWLNADHPDWMCGMFDGAVSGTPDGTCDDAEYMACRNFIAPNLFMAFGMPADVASAFPIDGVAMMQLQAIREGASAAGCDPRFQFFGVADGCAPSDFYSRDEIRLHYKKNLQQSTYTGSNRVVGTVKVGKNPSNAAHVNSFDLGATCYNPMDGSTFPCMDGGYINTTVSEVQLLGYTSAIGAELTNPALVGAGDAATVNCAACHTQSLATMNHPVSSATPGSCATCHTVLHQGVAVDIAATCGSCHTSGPGPVYTTTQLTALAANIHSTNPTARISASPDSATPFKVNFSAAGSTCPSGSTCSYAWDFGDGSAAGSGISTSRTYAGATPVTVTVTVTTDATPPASASASKTVTPQDVNLAPTGCEFGTVTVDQSTMTVSFTDSSNEGVVYMNWGDGTAMQEGAPGDVFTHTYLNKGRYTLRKVVRDSGGLSCRADHVVVINPTSGTAVDTYTVTITTTDYTVDYKYAAQKPACDAAGGTWSGSGPYTCSMPAFSGDMTCYLKQDVDGLLLTKYHGSGTGSCAITGVLDGTYQVFVAPAFPGKITGQPQTSVTVSGGAASAVVTVTVIP